MEDAQIIELFFARSEDAISELDKCSATRFLRNSDRIIEKK